MKSRIVCVIIFIGCCSICTAQSLGTFTPTGDMTIAREFHASTLLANGKVLIVGGAAVSQRADLQPLTTAELYDPNSGTFTATGKLNKPRWGITATLLNDGRVLIVGSDRKSTRLNSSHIPLS